MTMNYAAFKTYLRTFLWKDNDTVLASNLDTLIQMADAELNRALNIQRREITLLIAPETEDYELPVDFRSMVSLNNLNAGASKGGFTNTTALDIYAKRRASSSSQVLPYYSVSQGAGAQKILLLVGPFSVSDPGDLVLIYRANVPDFSAEDASWLETDFLDLYTYTILSHAAVFLREDERIPVWAAYKDKALASALEEDKHEVVFGGSPLKMTPHHKVP